MEGRCHCRADGRDGAGGDGAAVEGDPQACSLAPWALEPPAETGTSGGGQN